jgi:two-component system OmpR family sensor kinase
MASVRTRLTVAYTAAMGATLLLFGFFLALADAYRQEGLQRAAREHREEILRETAHAQAEFVVRVLKQASLEPRPMLVREDSSVTLAAAVPRAPRLELHREIGSRLTPLPGYLLVLGRGDSVLYNSPAAAALNEVDPAQLAGLDAEAADSVQRQAYDKYKALVNAGRALGEGRLSELVQVDGEDVILVARPLRDPDIPAERVVVGLEVADVFVPAERGLLDTMLIVAPLLLALSVGFAYVIAGQTFRPVERLMTQLEAITDGRSLHRRLPVDESGDELARLTVTLNAMLGRLENYFGALRRFTADASHELKTPLTVLRADVERAMHAGTTPAERLVALEEALHETTRMADLVEQLLTLARADEGRFDLHREPVPLGTLVRDVLETTVILGEDAGIAVEATALEDATVMGDGPRLRQLLLNLVTNAIKYTPRGGRVEIALRRAGDVVTFMVRDTGIGIAAADLPYIFDRFWRADRVRSRSGERGGFGLGLAISQWIAQAHGGSLTATSRLTRGSTFAVTLPIAPDGSTAEYAVPRRAELAARELGG